MEINNQHIESLISKHLDKTINAEEEKQLFAWVHENQANNDYFMQLKKLHFHTLHEDSVLFNTEVELQKAIENIQNSKKPKKRKIFAILTVAASVAILMSIILFTSTENTMKNVEEIAEIQIKAQDSIIDYTLEDGTVISIAKNSSIKVVDFSKKQRKISLKGTAYFDVERDTSRPFIIEVGCAQIEVLGTEFNIFERERDSSVSVWVTEGKVRVRHSVIKEEFILVDNEYCRLWENKKGEKGIYSNNNFLSWKTSHLTFEDTPLCQALFELEICYGKPFIPYGIDSIKNSNINITFDKTDISNVETILGMLLSASVEDIDSIIYIKEK